MAEELEQAQPELPAYCEALKGAVQEAASALTLGSATAVRANFILSQLVIAGAKLDFSNEAGRVELERARRAAERDALREPHDGLVARREAVRGQLAAARGAERDARAAVQRGRGLEHGEREQREPTRLRLERVERAERVRDLRLLGVALEPQQAPLARDPAADLAGHVHISRERVATTG
mgnify:CR=1 FL=1